MRNLDELRWEQFHIGDIFSVERPSARNKDNYEDGDVPFVASGAINNGVMKCCKPKDDEKLDKRECIAFDLCPPFIIEACPEIYICKGPLTSVELAFRQMFENRIPILQCRPLKYDIHI